VGYHIVPLLVHDEHGTFVPASSLLDSQIYVVSKPRTAQEHLLALAAAITAATGTKLEVTAIPAKSNGFNDAFGARPEPFAWGAASMVARDVLINLLDRSATSFSWRLYCQAASQADARFCVLDLQPLAVAVPVDRIRCSLVVTSACVVAMAWAWPDRYSTRKSKEPAFPDRSSVGRSRYQLSLHARSAIDSFIPASPSPMMAPPPRKASGG
jgi:hypothetical protein